MLAAIAIIVLDQTGAGIWGTVIPLWVFIASCGFGFPAVQVLALANHGAEAGTAASLLGAMNFGLAGVISPIVGLLGVAAATPMAVVMVGAVVIGTVVLWTVVRPRTVPALPE
jgi:DHA1 family bicyclomycin/chloramphenicol resistance-like MFS transporter